MADSTIAIDEPVTVDKLLDCESLLVGGQTVQRERMRVAGALDIELARVASVVPGAGDYGLVVRNIPSGTQVVSAAAFDIRPLAKATDNVYAVLKTDAGIVYDARDRSWVITEAVDVSDRVGRAIGQLTDGVAAYVAAKTGQLPTVLTGGGNLKVAIVESTATVTVQGTGNFNVVGIASDNTANSAAKLPVIAARANAAEQAWTEGNMVPLSVTLAGRVRMTVADWLGSTAPTVGSKTSASSIPVVIASDQASVPINQTQATAGFERPRKLVTYRVNFRLAARPYALSFTTVANTRKQVATIHHAATATKTVKIRHLWLALKSVATAGIYGFELIRITTAPVTGNPVITPAALDPADAAAEVTCLGLPTTAATEAGANVGFQEYNVGITPAVPVVNPPAGYVWYDLLALAGGVSPDFEDKLPVIRAGVLEGWAVTLDPNAAGVTLFFVMAELTEE